MFWAQLAGIAIGTFHVTPKVRPQQRMEGMAQWMLSDGRQRTIVEREREVEAMGILAILKNYWLKNK
jgi:hypothetical protein